MGQPVLTLIWPHLPQGPADRGSGHHHGGRAAMVAHGQVQPVGGETGQDPAWPGHLDQRQTAYKSGSKSQGRQQLKGPHT